MVVSGSVYPPGNVHILLMEEILHHLVDRNYPTIYMIFYIPGGFLGGFWISSINSILPGEVRKIIDSQVTNGREYVR